MTENSAVSEEERPLDDETERLIEEYGEAYAYQGNEHPPRIGAALEALRARIRHLLTVEYQRAVDDLNRVAYRRT